MISEEKKKKSGLYGNVLPLGFVSFFTDVSTEMIFSILPSFILGLPGAGYARDPLRAPFSLPAP